MEEAQRLGLVQARGQDVWRLHGEVGALASPPASDHHPLLLFFYSCWSSCSSSYSVFFRFGKWCKER